MDASESSDWDAGYQPLTTQNVEQWVLGRVREEEASPSSDGVSNESGAAEDKDDEADDELTPTGTTTPSRPNAVDKYLGEPRARQPPSPVRAVPIPGLSDTTLQPMPSSPSRAAAMPASPPRFGGSSPPGRPGGSSFLEGIANALSAMGLGGEGGENADEAPQPEEPRGRRQNQAGCMPPAIFHLRYVLSGPDIRSSTARLFSVPPFCPSALSQRLHQCNR